MIPGKFDYRRADSVEEAVRILSTSKDARLLAGGHSLLPMMKLGLAAPGVLIDIRGVEELGGISVSEDDVVIGAITTHAEVADSAEVAAGFAALAQAARSIGDVQVRNCGTLGGSLAHADPAADYGAAVLTLDAVVEATGPDGSRTIPVEDFFAGFFTTVLEPAEMVTAVRFPRRPEVASAYVKLAQPASGYAVVGVAAAVACDPQGACTVARIAATGVADRPLRLRSSEAALAGRPLDEDAIAAAAAAADSDVDDVRSDMHAAEDYRRHLLRVMVGRAVARALPSPP